jgi:hypothetical protein
MSLELTNSSYYNIEKRSLIFDDPQSQWQNALKIEQLYSRQQHQGIQSSSLGLIVLPIPRKISEEALMAKILPESSLHLT